MTTLCPSCGRAYSDHAPCMECYPVEQEKHRASWMPSHLESVTFLDGVREYAPDESSIKEKE